MCGLWSTFRVPTKYIEARIDKYVASGPCKELLRLGTRLTEAVFCLYDALTTGAFFIPENRDFKSWFSLAILCVGLSVKNVYKYWSGRLI